MIPPGYRPLHGSAYGVRIHHDKGTKLCPPCEHVELVLSLENERRRPVPPSPAQADKRSLAELAELERLLRLPDDEHVAGRHLRSAS